MENFDFIAYLEKLKRSLNQSLAATDTDAELCLVMSDLLETVEKDLAKNLSAEDHKIMACAPGCSSCCIVNVEVLTPEAKNIANYLKRTRNDEQLVELKQRMKQLLIVISGLDDEERIAVRRNCVFLCDQGKCSIYPVRPLLCRSITSICAQSCHEALTMQALGEENVVVMNLFQKNLMDIAFQGLAGAMEGHGLDARAGELTAAILAQLS
ncbi:MAG: YkgJ family cysteine cluster protein [Desulfuromonas sp.]|nr:YkgJ family cysteine cluster protein [Desulfuromonas sp.]